MKNLNILENCIQYYDVIKSSKFLSELFNNHYEFIKNNDVPIDLYSYIYLNVTDDIANLFTGVYIYLGILKNKNKYSLYFRVINTLVKNPLTNTTYIDLTLTLNEFNEYFYKNPNEIYIKRYMVPIENHNENMLNLQKAAINNKQMTQIIFKNSDLKNA